VVHVTLSKVYFTASRAYDPLLTRACTGHKSSVQSHLNYLVIVSPPMTVSASHTSATVRHFAARSSTSADITKLTVFDIENKFVAYSGTFTEGVKEVFCEWGQIFVLSNDGKVCGPGFPVLL
jgi:vacuolar protein sorting-associated protein 11